MDRLPGRKMILGFHDLLWHNQRFSSDIEMGTLSAARWKHFLPSFAKACLLDCRKGNLRMSDPVSYSDFDGSTVY
jgi:hypothetical protein